MESLRKRTGKKFTALLLSALMVFTLLPPMTAQAEGSSAIWDGTADTSWYNESESIFEISTAEQLAGLSQLVNSGTSFYQKTIKLTQNIVLNDTSDWENWATSPPANVWTAIGISANSFYAGAFDGQGFEISGIYINNSLVEQGLFGYVFESSIRNVGVVKSYIKADNCVGGVVGHSQGMIINCYNTGDVSGNHHVGGVVGYNKNARIIDCYNDGYVSGTKSVGGVVGQNNKMDLSRKVQFENTQN